MLRVAVPNKGSLSGPAVQLLGEAGFQINRRCKELTAVDEENKVTFNFLRAPDIARHVGTGTLDVGITGQDLVAEVGTTKEVTELLRLNFGVARFCFAAPRGTYRVIGDLDGKTVATSYSRLVERAADDAGIRLEIAELDGAVEIAVELGLADAVADLVETGASLRATGMEIVGEPVLRSEAILVRGRNRLSPDREHKIEHLMSRLQGIVLARNHVVIEYNCPTDVLEIAAKIASGTESPTIARLSDERWVAVRVMVKQTDAQTIMDQLWSVGARAIFSHPIESCRL
ncbi:ATP phosphoribosyltransferase [Saccharopolyspora shandongensis]|uniref:ATP phosphoribosyltransferase n=1 Tax=Saccharopolyspora shandongensis TaxID=418495 RepID=UPI0033F518B2